MSERLRPRKIAKALLGGLVAFVGAVATAYADSTMSTPEWWAAASAGVVALAGVYGVRNSAPSS